MITDQAPYPICENKTYSVSQLFVSITNARNKTKRYEAKYAKTLKNSYLKIAKESKEKSRMLQHCLDTWYAEHKG